MHKDELIQLHQLLVYMRKLLKKRYGDSIDEYFTSYDRLKIYPHHIHRTKSEHTYAIFLLASAIAKVLSEYGNVPRSVSSRLRSSGEKIERELVRQRRGNNKIK
ncbi:MAG TPA: UPF0058 family protein [Methanothermococcus okinawensis]|uniref:UPF0058 family protein n=1 Tax=Methanothermococcus okinawensis TaxID=155863 RepID=A0A832ZZZ4_9EURY|nr:UPF0058 family protein [Methanothermococcus okinawensis]